MLVARASSGQKIPCRERHRIYVHDHQVKTPRWHSCNVLQVGSDSRQVWQFATGNGRVALNAEARLPLPDPLPVKLVSKDWRALWRKKFRWIRSRTVLLLRWHWNVCRQAAWIHWLSHPINNSACRQADSDNSSVQSGRLNCRAQPRFGSADFATGKSRIIKHESRVRAS